jgi:trigger factor
LKISAEKDQQSQYIIRIEIEPEELETAKGKAAKRLAGRVRIPGFRPGKAPQAIVARFLGQEALVEEATRDLMPKAYEEALKNEDIRPIGEPDIKLESTDPLTIIATVPVEPTVLIGDYKSIKFDAPTVEVTDEDVNKVLEQLLEQNSTWEEPADERAAQDGDQVEVEMQTLRDGELVGNPFNRTGILGKHELLEQIEQQVAGMQVGEERDITVVREKANSAEAETGEEALDATAEAKAGVVEAVDVPEVETIPLEPEEAVIQAQAPMHFHVKLNSVKEKHVPTLDDDFATTVSDLKTMDELQARVRENVLRQKQNDANRELTDKFVKEAVAQSHIEMPPQLVNQQIHALEENLGQRLKQQKLTVDQYLSITGKSHEEFHEDLRPQAEEQLRNQLVLVEIAKAEGVKVEDAEVEAEIDQFVEQYTQNAPADTLDQQKQRLRELYSNQQMRENISNDLFSRKLGERLIELSTGIKPSSPQIQAVNASEAALDLKLKTDQNLATEASEAKEELTQGAIEEEDAQA